MKKFVKGCAITALVLAVIGVILFAIGMFGDGPATLRQMVRDGRFSIGSGDWFEWNFNKSYDIEDSSIFFEEEGNYAIQEGAVEFSASKEEVDSLDVDLGGCDLMVVSSASDNLNYEVETQGSGKYQVYVKNGTLHIKGQKKLHYNGTDQVILYVPEGETLGWATFELGAGEFEMDSLTATNLAVSLGAGSLEAKYLQGTDVNIEVGAGEVVVRSGYIGNLNLAVGAGNIEWESQISGDVKADVAMGALDLVVQGSKEEDHNYYVSGAMGNMVIGSREWSGFGTDMDIDNQAPTDYHLTCAMGELIVQFTQ